STPLRDVLRGRLSASLDARQIIATAGLPGPLAELSWRVVRESRLWRREKGDIARELVSHFADGVASGKPTADLAADFGEPRAAARMIRRAKKRQRGWMYQCWRRLFQAVAVALLVGLVLYALLAARYFLFRPQIRHNYMAELNAPV